MKMEAEILYYHYNLSHYHRVKINLIDFRGKNYVQKVKYNCE